MSVAKRLVVAGGNGFLGSRICKSAVQRGWDVTSISRSGMPKWDAVTASATPPAWSHKVAWERGDIFRPATYATLVRGVDFVVHSMGILLEADYKGVVRGQESPVSGLRRAFAPDPRPGAENPLRRRDSVPPGSNDDGDIRPPENRGQLTYESMNRDSAIALAAELARGGSGSATSGTAAFVYISAAAGAPVLPARYISTKREAESAIAREFPTLRGIFFRPPFLYDSSRPITMPMAAMTGLGAIFNGVTGGLFGNFMGAAGVKPLKADTVAEAVVQALSDDAIKGVVEVPEIEELANKAWRSTML